MKKITFLLFFLALMPGIQQAQYRWDIGGGPGLANYLGDIGGKENTRRDFVADLKMAKTRINFNAFARMRLYAIRRSYLKFEMNYLMIEGADQLSTNPGRQYRNLDFRNNIFELSSTFQFVFFEHLDLGRTYRYRDAFRAYVFGGVGLFHHSPKGFYNGEWVRLRPLKTEGQAKAYSPIGVSLPAGLGFSFTFRKRHRISWELNWRTTFTDYLDDISTVYADPNALSSPVAVAMANKTDRPVAESYETGFSNNYDPGAKRGDPTHRDSYLTTNISYSYVIRGRSCRWPGRDPRPWTSRMFGKKIRLRAKF